MAGEWLKKAPISVWWDYKNCEIQETHDDLDLIKGNICCALKNMGYGGIISVNAYGDTTLIETDIQEAFFKARIILTHTSKSKEKIITDFTLWTKDNPQPCTIMVISGDTDFAKPLHILNLAGYHILIAARLPIPEILCDAAKHVWSFDRLLNGGPPEPLRLSTSSAISHAVEKKVRRSFKEGDPTRVIFEVLNVLKSEEILPFQDNIINCLNYGDLKQREKIERLEDIHLKLTEVLGNAQYFQVRFVGRKKLFTPKGEDLWNVIHPIGGHPVDYPKQIWNKLELYLRSPDGCKKIQNSECSYEIATIIKKHCLLEISVGKIIQIVDLAVRLIDIE
ncbi:uncharacterized protein [Rutidosis leptorrhynchoides]|uniref:uncharacterized protein n=1 Tax=Rutidosis leptorrhynchoides TaxID=125765 RepID=UPI003A9A2E3C